MLSISVDELEPGMVLARPVPNPNRPEDDLLKRGYVLDEKVIQRMRDLGIGWVVIRHGDLSFLENLVSESVEQEYRQVFSLVRRQFERQQEGNPAQLDYRTYQSQVKMLFESVISNPKVLESCTALIRHGDYLMSHAANVCYLSLLVGMKIEHYVLKQRRIPEEYARNMVSLGMGALIHDIGMSDIDQAIVNKPAELDETEEREIRKHPILGYMKARDTFKPNEANIVLHHHQRFDGSGYPPVIDSLTGDIKPPLSGDSIPVFSRIVAPCDVYDAATNTRPYRGARMPVEVLREMKQELAGGFDPVVLDAFFDIVPAFPLGSRVVLCDGSRGAVVEHPGRHHPCRPIVKLLVDAEGNELEGPRQIELDLSRPTNEHLHIKTWQDHDVEPYLFD